MKHTLWLYLLILCSATATQAQTSSIYLVPQTQQPQQVQPVYTSARPIRNNTLSPTIEAYSFTAVTPPKPRLFEINDLVAIIIRESTTTSFDSKLKTDKTSDYEGEISDFPSLNLAKLLQFQLQASHNTNPPELSIEFKSKFDAKGKYSTNNQITSRVTARVIDVKPNGTIVLEARKFIQSDDESMSLVLTGTCRAEDIDISNTILSTDLYDLNLVKQGQGTLRKNARKGFLTKLFDFLFSF